MKISKLFLFFPFFFLLYSCTRINKTELILDLKETTGQVHLGYGFWINELPGYYRAKSYKGFQAPKYASSISIEKLNGPFDITEIEFLESIKHKSIRILAKRPIIINSEHKGLYIKSFDKNTKTYWQKIIIKNEGQVYKIVSFYTKAQKAKYKRVLTVSLFSLSFGKELSEKKDIVLARFKDNRLTYTRDGIFPTKSDDEFVVEEEYLEIKNLLTINNLLEKKLEEISGKLIPGYTINEKNPNLKIYTKLAKSKNQTAFVIIILIKSEDAGILLRCSGNSKLDLNEANKIINNKYFKLQSIHRQY